MNDQETLDGIINSCTEILKEMNLPDNLMEEFKLFPVPMKVFITGNILHITQNHSMADHFTGTLVVIAGLDKNRAMGTLSKITREVKPFIEKVYHYLKLKESNDSATKH